MPTLANLFAITPPALPTGYCPNPPTWQQVANDLFNGAQITALVDTGMYQFNYGPTTPTVDNRLFPWLNTGDGRWYSFQFGLWVSPHPVPPSGGYEVLWHGPNDGSATGLWTFDGGDGTDPSVPANVSATTGSFWQVDTGLAARFPLGPGTLPSATVVAENDTGGEETHVLTVPELAAHDHWIMNSQQNTGATALTPGNYLAEARYDLQYTLEAADTPPTTPNVGLTSQTGSGTGHNTMPPWRARYFIVRTMRRWYTVSP